MLTFCWFSKQYLIKNPSFFWLLLKIGQESWVGVTGKRVFLLWNDVGVISYNTWILLRSGPVLRGVCDGPVDRDGPQIDPGPQRLTKTFSFSLHTRIYKIYVRLRQNLMYIRCMILCRKTNKWNAWTASLHLQYCGNNKVSISVTTNRNRPLSDFFITLVHCNTFYTSLHVYGFIFSQEIPWSGSCA